jgi:hypothetical protein
MLLISTLFACGGGILDIDDPSDDTDPPVCSQEDLGETYERYVEPLMTDAHPSTCNDCHLAGVDLGMFIQDEPCASMACLVDMGWVDLSEPEASQVLDFIMQGESDSSLITDEVVQREYDGFLEWILWSAECHDDVCGVIEDPCSMGGGESELPDQVLTPIGGCDEDSLVASFSEKVFDWHGRCWSCHVVGGESRDDWPGTTFFEWTDDPEVSIRLTMYNLIGLGAIDVDDPPNSKLITKPLAEDVEVTTEAGTSVGIWHGGGDKFHLDNDGGFTDPTYADFLDWILEYAACLN